MNTITIIYIVITVIIATAAIMAIRLGYKKQVSEILFYLVNKAEQQFGGGTGELKFAAVSAWIYEQMPFAIRIFFTTKQVDKLIEIAVERMKLFLTTNIQASRLIVGSAK